MALDIEALQQLPAPEAGLAEDWCCWAYTFVTCFSGTFQDPQAQ